jgi:hypothetical protein
MMADWLVRAHVPAWLHLAGLTTQADAVASLPEIADFAQCVALMPTLEAARIDAAAARDAARAAWDTVGDAARDAAESAAFDATMSAASFAARIVTWARARSLRRCLEVCRGRCCSEWCRGRSRSRLGRRRGRYSRHQGACLGRTAHHRLGRSTRDTAWDAARTAAWNAAQAAVWDAVMDTTRVTAGAAAWNALNKTRLELQQSALALVERMIAALPG